MKFWVAVNKSFSDNGGAYNATLEIEVGGGDDTGAGSNPQDAIRNNPQAFVDTLAEFFAQYHPTLVPEDFDVRQVAADITTDLLVPETP